MQLETYLIGVHDGYDQTPRYYKMRAENAGDARAHALRIYNAHESVAGRVCLAVQGDVTVLCNADFGDAPAVLDLGTAPVNW
ncbi:hypothetical protein GURKE_02150 [Brevundimonas phage vB_BpoS-Gurke]|uniref:Uncharacterized protein n=1 Tax=Brevundimonas phage vB_BpoS-Gurke TaxID=2948599 RepID=A0A9E7N4W7_9CAUD|nr:hypothetical protein GURKE_02150 [Brevundimonas phage vB_BpoS-Gurke]